MDTQNVVNIEGSKYCFCCKKIKLTFKFTRPCGNNIAIYSICNSCAEIDRQNRQSVRFANVKSSQLSTLNYNNNDDNTEIPVTDNDKNNKDLLLYELCNLKAFMINNFKDSEEKDNSVEFSVIVKIKRELANDETLSPELNHNKQDIKFCNIVNILIISLQKQFKLFLVNVNCSGYEVLLAYLYVDTHAASEECLLNPNNIVHTRVGVLREFFIELRSEEIFPTFVLLDKDSGEIAATQESWSQIAVIQLCLWYVEHAIECKLKEKKPRESQYSAQKANKAHQQFAFIDPL
ncbi:8740_t:CDS:2 [Cetraspora pellucida]|uniref:8740_t:CDS:1 n=1 Tax=Cetraspora pellucida TaxID=1433469 RepID=A0ACA9NYN6_9GLOM|nr:8740_t:CDS:2 [Cetraspora pellucida]